MALQLDGKSLRDLKEDRQDLIVESRKIIDDAGDAGLTPDKREKFDRMAEDIQQFTDAIDAREKDRDRADRLAKLEGQVDNYRASAPPADVEDRGNPREPESRSFTIAGNEIVCRRESDDPWEQRAYHCSSPQYVESFKRYLRGNSAEARHLQVTPDAQGGYTVPPMQFVAEIIKFIDDMVFVRANGTVTPVTSGKSIGAPTLVADPSDADWTTELGTGNEDTTMAFGQRELEPHPLAKRMKVSRKLIRSSAIDIMAFTISRLGYKAAITEEKAYLVGDGTNQPLGVYTADANGVPTTRDVATGDAADLTADGIIDCFYNLKEGYLRNARWNWSREAVKRIQKLKTTEDQYLWQPGLQVGTPDLILGRPFDMSEYTPNAFTDQAYVGMIADWSYYWIADSLDMTIQVLSELYAETNQQGIILRKETDGAPTVAEAFSRMKVGLT